MQRDQRINEASIRIWLNTEWPEISELVLMATSPGGLLRIQLEYYKIDTDGYNVRIYSRHRGWICYGGGISFERLKKIVVNEFEFKKILAYQGTILCSPKIDYIVSALFGIGICGLGMACLSKTYQPIALITTLTTIISLVGLLHTFGPHITVPGKKIRRMRQIRQALRVLPLPIAQEIMMHVKHND